MYKRQVRDFGGMVFSVSPMNSAPAFVHPLANDFEDFLRLLLACSDSAALEQAWLWDKAQFEAFLQDNPPTQDLSLIHIYYHTANGSTYSLNGRSTM